MAQAEKRKLRRDLRSPDYVLLRQRIIEARKAAGLTQAIVATRVGRPQSFIAKLEGGERAIDIIELLAIARVVNLDFDAVIAELSKLDTAVP